MNLAVKFTPGPATALEPHEFFVNNLLYVDQIVRLMGLSHWNIDISGEPAAPGNMADIYTPVGRCCATLRFSDAYYEAAPHQRRQTVVHELLHCWFAPTAQCAQLTVPRTVYAAIGLHLEYGIDGLAEAIAGTMPLPD